MQGQIDKIKAHLLEGSYDMAILEDIVNHCGLKLEEMSYLLSLYSQISSQVHITPESGEKLSILCQLISATDRKISSVKQADWLCESANNIIKYGLKNSVNYSKVIIILKKAIQILTDPWYFLHYKCLLNVSSIPTLFGYEQNLANRQVADLAYKKFIRITQVDLVMGVYDWIKNVICCYGKHVPQEILLRIHDFLRVLQGSSTYFPGQYKGKVFYFKAFMYHYYGKKDKKTFDKALLFYKASLKTDDSQNHFASQIQSGKYLSIFHFSRLLKHPQAFGFDPEWKNTIWAAQLEQYKNNLLQKGACYHSQIIRCLGFQLDRRNLFHSSDVNYEMGQFDDLDDNYVRAMKLTEKAMELHSKNLNSIATFKHLRAWLYIQKGYLFENSHSQAVKQMTECLEAYIKSLEGKFSGFDFKYMTMAERITEIPECRKVAEIVKLQEYMQTVEENSPKIRYQMTKHRANLMLD